MANLQEYKCPCCGGAISFDTSIQKLKCPYCDTEFEVSTLADYDKELSSDKKDSMDWGDDTTVQWQEGDEEGLRVYVCKSCGGEIIGDENTAAMSCPYCDNPIVVMGSVKGQLKPDYIIPFKLDKKAAMAKYKEHLQGKKLLPKAFKTNNHIEEIKGMYVPYWVFDSDADAHIRYRGEKVRTWSDAKNNYTETSHYAISRSGSISFEHVPADGSAKLDDTLMESLEPFDFKDAVPFQTAYFAGYVADKYDVSKEQVLSRVNERMKRSTEDEFRSTVNGFTNVIPENTSISLVQGKANYVMYPAWIMTTKWNGQNYIFAMNGQTGKFVGDLPSDKSITTKIFIKTTVIVTLIAFLVQSLFYFV